MDEKQGSLTHFSGLIRIIVLALIVLVLGFFFVRWASNRRADVEVRNGSTTKVSNESKSATKNKDEKNTPTTEDTPIPSGIAESEATPDDPAPSTGPTTVPAAGMDANILLTTLMIFVGSYLLYLNTRLKQSLMK